MTTTGTRILVNKFDKQLLTDLPRAAFGGRIIVVSTEREAEKAVGYLMGQRMLGFDTETRPSFRPGPMHPVALLQVATEDTCFLFRLNLIDVPDCLVRLLGDDGITKVALSWHDDTNQLHRRRPFRMGQFVDLQTYVRQFGIEDMSLQKLYANVFGEKISKSQQLTNWEADTLTASQKLYAATDAWACLRLYQELEKLRVTNNWELKRYVEPVSE